MEPGAELTVLGTHQGPRFTRTPALCEPRGTGPAGVRGGRGVSDRLGSLAADAHNLE